MSCYADQLLEQIKAEDAKINEYKKLMRSAMEDLREAGMTGKDTSELVSLLDSIESNIESAKTEIARLKRVRNEEMSWR
jgi:flagellar biosynthesis chaperone FliJ